MTHDSMLIRSIRYHGVMICDTAHDSMLIRSIQYYGAMICDTVCGMLTSVHTVLWYNETCLVTKIVSITITYS